MKRKWGIVLTAALLLVGAESTRALTFLELVTGDEGLVPDARSVALGRTRIGEATGAFTACTNPALLSVGGPPRAGVGGDAMKLKETRSIPAYDSFDAFLVESIYVLNDDVLFEGGVGASGSFGEEWVGGGVGVGFSWAPVRDFQYDYIEEVRDNDAFTRPRDALIGVNEISSSGGLAAFSLGVGLHPLPRASVGVSLERVHGGFNLLRRTRFIREGTAETSVFDVDDLAGWRGLVGVAVHPDSRLDASVTWRTETNLDGNFESGGDSGAFSFLGEPENTTDAAGEFDVRYPHEIGVGAAWKPRAKSRTVVRGEATWTQWSEFSSDLAPDTSLDDVVDVRFGIEHVFYNNFPMRFGFLYVPSPRDEEIAGTSFTFGGGLPAGPVTVDLAFEVRHRAYRFEDLFEDSMFGGLDRTATDRVEESSAAAFLTLGYVFRSRGE